MARRKWDFQGPTETRILLHRLGLLLKLEHKTASYPAHGSLNQACETIVTKRRIFVVIV
jgi:hypothetical protein